jgi:hypothetical protein
VDGERFDRLTRLVAGGVSRRRVISGSVASAVVGLLGRGEATAAPSACAVGCAGLPGPQKAACTQACRQCGGDFNRVCPTFGPFGPTSFTCCPEGTACDSSAGSCIELEFCEPGVPAENCAVGVSADCGPGGACGLVDDADGEGCQCIERACTGILCTTDADCTDGLTCVSAPGCCAEAAFCGIPCGSAGATGVQTTAAWGS